MSALIWKDSQARRYNQAVKMIKISCHVGQISTFETVSGRRSLLISWIRAKDKRQHSGDRSNPPFGRHGGRLATGTP